MRIWLKCTEIAKRDDGSTTVRLQPIVETMHEPGRCSRFADHFEITGGQGSGMKTDAELKGFVLGALYEVALPCARCGCPKPQAEGEAP